MGEETWKEKGIEMTNRLEIEVVEESLSAVENSNKKILEEGFQVGIEDIIQHNPISKSKT